MENSLLLCFSSVLKMLTLYMVFVIQQYIPTAFNLYKVKIIHKKIHMST